MTVVNRVGMVNTDSSDRPTEDIKIVKAYLPDEQYWDILQSYMQI